MSFLEKSKATRHMAVWISLGLAAVFVLTIGVMLRHILTPVIIALVLAYIFNPLLSWLEKHRFRRWMTTILLYVLALLLLSIAGATLGPRIKSQAQRLYRNVSVMAQDYGGALLSPEEKDGGACDRITAE